MQIYGLWGQLLVRSPRNMARLPHRVSRLPRPRVSRHPRPRRIILDAVTLSTWNTPCGAPLAHADPQCIVVLTPHPAGLQPMNADFVKQPANVKTAVGLDGEGAGSLTTVQLQHIAALAAC